MSNDAPQRTRQLLAVRRQVSADKRARVTAVIAEMLAQGLPITAASVARAADCSTWLVYSPGPREHLDHARLQQATNGLANPASDAQPSTAGLRTDLVLARQEIARLRDENRLLHHDSNASSEPTSTAPVKKACARNSPSSRPLNNSSSASGTERSAVSSSWKTLSSSPRTNSPQQGTQPVR